MTTAQAPQRERKFAELDLARLAEDGTFEGYASLFGRVDLGRDVVEPGAFARSLARRGAAGVRMLFQHDPNQPIGTWTDIREDARGLLVRGRLASGVGKAREVLELMRGGALDGLSIGFKTVRAIHDPVADIRTIHEADLWEISVVTFPMLPDARVSEVKARTALPSVRTFERWLTRDAGLTRSQARIVIAKGFSSLTRGRDAADDAGPTRDPLVAIIRKAATLIHPKGRNT